MDSNAVEKLINKVCTNFSTKLQEALNIKIDGLHAELTAIKSSVETFSTKIEDNSKSIAFLHTKCDYFEQLLKKNSLRLNGIPEKVNEDIPTEVAGFFKDKLNIKLSLSDIDTAFRIGPMKLPASFPRPIVVSLISNITKTKITAARKMLKGTKFTIFEDLTGARYSLLQAAKKKYGKAAWSSGGKIFIWSATYNKKIEVKSPADL